MKLSHILNEYFDEASREALTALMTEQGLYQPLSDIAERFYVCPPADDKEGRVVQFSIESIAFIAVVSYWLKQLNSDEHSMKKRETMAPLLVCMAVEALLHFRLKPHEVYRAVAGLVMADEYIASHHRDTFYRFTDWVQEKWLDIQHTDKKAYVATASCQPVYFIWNLFTYDKEKYLYLDICISDLYKHWHRHIKLSEIRQLFENSQQPFTVKVPSQYLLEFLAIFYFMHQRHRISCKNSKGIFVYLKNHLQPPDGDAYPDWTDYSKLLHRELHHPQRRVQLLKNIKNILEKYVPGFSLE